MIIVYGDKQCLTCMILKTLLKDSKINYRFFEMDIDYTYEEIKELYPQFDTVPFILRDGEEITLVELEKMII